MEIVPVDETHLIAVRIDMTAEIEPRESSADDNYFFHTYITISAEKC